MSVRIKKNSKLLVDSTLDRVCPGRKLAVISLFISTLMILATFNISKARDENGRVIEPDRVYQPGTIRSVFVLPLTLLVLD